MLPLGAPKMALSALITASTHCPGDVVRTAARSVIWVRGVAPGTMPGSRKFFVTLATKRDFCTSFVRGLKAAGAGVAAGVPAGGGVVVSVVGGLTATRFTMRSRGSATVSARTVGPLSSLGGPGGAG